METTSTDANGQAKTSRDRGPRKGTAGPPVVLVVDDVADNLLALEGMLRREDVEILTASSGREALEILLEREVAVAIIDVMMPEMDGFELAELIRGVELTRRVPIIFVTAGSKADYRVFTGYETGAIDFLFKPLDERVLRAKVDVLVSLERQRREAERARAETEILLRFAQTTSQSEKPAEIYDPALDGVRDLLGAERSAILLFDQSDRMRFEAWRGLSDSYRATVDGHSPWRRDEKNPGPILIGDVTIDERMAGYRSIFAAERISAIAFVPLVAGDLLGKFMLYWGQPRTFSAHDEALAVAIASQVAEGLTRARLREAERNARAQAEAAQAWMAFVAEASAELAKSLDYELTLRRVAELAVPRLADWCAVDMVPESEGELAHVAVVHADPAKVQLAYDLWRRYPFYPDAPYGVPHVLATGQSEFHREISNDMIERAVRDPEHIEIILKLGMRSAIVVPIVIGGRTIGTISFVMAESERRYDERDLEMAEEIGRRAAVAIENARLFEAERRARTAAQVAEERRAAIQLVSDAALANLEIEPLLAEMLARVRRVFRCDTATILMLSADGKRLEVRAADGIEREAWDRVGVPHGAGFAGRIVAEKRPMVINDVAAAGVVSVILKERLRSMMGVPLVLERGAVGVIHVGSFQQREFAEADVELLQMVAARAATAIDRANAYEALRVAEEKLRVALSAGKMGVWEWSIPAGRVSWSPTLEMIHGLEPGTFPGTIEAYQSDMHPDDKDQVLRTIQETLAAGRDHHVEYRIVRPDGQVRWVAGYGNLVSRVDGKPGTMMGVCLDITERKQLERARESALAEVKQTLRDNEMFAAVLAHDLRNPLGVILTATQLVLQRRPAEAGTVLSPLRRVISSSERMTRMIDQLLDFTRVRVGRGFELDAREADIMEICRHVLGEVELAHPEWKVNVEGLGDFKGIWDRDRLLQVVSNLMTNAGMHGSSGAEILVKVDGTERDSVSLQVHNEGAIPESLLANVFSPFRGTRERGSGGGLGLGIYIANEIVCSHGGMVDVSSSEAAGTTFTVKLPRRYRTSAVQ